jgi:hypothetical protein
VARRRVWSNEADWNGLSMPQLSPKGFLTIMLG